MGACTSCGNRRQGGAQLIDVPLVHDIGREQPQHVRIAAGSVRIPFSISADCTSLAGRDVFNPSRSPAP